MVTTDWGGVIRHTQCYVATCVVSSSYRWNWIDAGRDAYKNGA
jgi:hypothetical protein